MTTVVDNFNRPDNATALGTTSDGKAVWQTQQGQFGIVSNAAACTATNGSAAPFVAVLETNASDGTVQATFPNGSSAFPAVLVRSTGWGDNIAVVSGFIVKTIAGSSSNISSTSPTFGAGDVVAVTLSGTSISVSVNGGTPFTVTDSFNQTATQHGLRCNAAGGTDRWDDFSAPFVVPLQVPSRLIVPPLAVIQRVSSW